MCKHGDYAGRALAASLSLGHGYDSFALEGHLGVARLVIRSP